LRFTHGREHEEGGFTLYHGIPDTKNTYYGVKMIKMFNEEPYNKVKTIEWIEELQKGRMYGLHGVFYRVNILNSFKQKIRFPTQSISKLNSKNDFSNMKIAYYYTILSKILKLKNLKKIAKWILAYQNVDGGFGVNRSDIQSTYYAMESLNCINPSLINNKNLISNYVYDCQTWDGGFAFIPDIYPPYIEPTYAGIRILEILDIKPKKQDKIVHFVQNLQNSNGGFRRSKYIGISELEYTFKGLYILKSISYL
jgi:hypothetical protein